MVGKTATAIMLVAVLAGAACSSAAESPTTLSPTVAPTVVAQPTIEPAPREVIRGAFQGSCKLLKKRPSDLEALKVQRSIRWHFRQSGPSKLSLTSKSGGYTMELARTGKHRFYGSVTKSDGWQFAYTLTATAAGTDGIVTRVEIVSHDTFSGGDAAISYDCTLRRV